MCFAVHSRLSLPINGLVGYPSGLHQSPLLSFLSLQSRREPGWQRGPGAKETVLDSKSEVETLTQASVWPWAVTLPPEPRFPHQHEGYSNHSPSRAVVRGTRDHAQAEADCPGRL